jgi:hypothetical protein
MDADLHRVERAPQDVCNLTILEPLQVVQDDHGAVFRGEAVDELTNASAHLGILEQAVGELGGRGFGVGCGVGKKLRLGLGGLGRARCLLATLVQVDVGGANVSCVRSSASGSSRVIRCR